MGIVKLGVRVDSPLNLASKKDVGREVEGSGRVAVSKSRHGIEFLDRWRDNKVNMADLKTHCRDCFEELGQGYDK